MMIICSFIAMPSAEVKDTVIRYSMKVT